MTEQEYKDGYFNSHTVEVTIDGAEERVSIIYLSELKRKLGNRMVVSKAATDAAAQYIAEVKGREREREKVAKAAQANANAVAGKSVKK
jgi:hypothetical protein